MLVEMQRTVHYYTSLENIIKFLLYYDSSDCINFKEHKMIRLDRIQWDVL